MAFAAAFLVGVFDVFLRGVMKAVRKSAMGSRAPNLIRMPLPWRPAKPGHISSIRTFSFDRIVFYYKQMSALYRNAFRLEEYVRPQLRQLVQVTQESASFFRAEGNQRICLVREHSNRVVRDHAFEGDLLPMNGSAGRVLTVFRDCQSGNIPRQLLAMLPVVSLGEADREIAGIAVPVFDSKGLAGALAISGPIYRFTDQVIRRFKSLILEAGQELSVSLGGTAYGDLKGRRL